MTPISAELLALLACPVPECRASLRLTENGLQCLGCSRTYPVTETGPVLIPEDAAGPTVERPGPES